MQQHRRHEYMQGPATWRPYRRLAGPHRSRRSNPPPCGDGISLGRWSGVQETQQEGQQIPPTSREKYTLTLGRLLHWPSILQKKSRSQYPQIIPPAATLSSQQTLHLSLASPDPRNRPHYIPLRPSAVRSCSPCSTPLARPSGMSPLAVGKSWGRPGRAKLD